MNPTPDRPFTIQGGGLPDAGADVAQGRQGPAARRRLPALRQPVHRGLHLPRQELHGRRQVRSILTIWP